MTARVATSCSSGVCTQLLVRGTAVSMISVERVRQLEKKHGGSLPRVDDGTLVTRLCPADLKFPGFVLVHDTEGAVYSRCDVYLVNWRASRSRAPINPSALATAREYFGDGVRVASGSTHVPGDDVEWKRVTRVQFIRYFRHGKGFAREPGVPYNGHEHEYSTPVWLYSSRTRPLAWKLSLASGCIIDNHGFVRP